MSVPPRPGAGKPSGAGLEAVFGRGASAFRRRFGLVALTAIVMLVLLGSFLALRQYEDGKDKALNDLRARAVLASTVFDTYFAGQLSTLSSIADSPSVVRADTAEMATYFAQLQGGAKRELFTGGLGWIDRNGISRVSGTNPRGTQLSVSDRSFFKAVMATGRPFISEGLTSRVSKLRVVVMAVPTRDAKGRITGVLAGAFELRPSPTNQRTTDLGFDGLVVIDRAGQQLTLRSFARPENTALVGELKKGDGVIADTRGLDGSADRAVAFANSKAPGWITVIDRPRSALFASAQRSLELEMASILAACDRGHGDRRLGDRALLERHRGRAPAGAAVGRALAVARGRICRRRGVGRARIGSDQRHFHRLARSSHSSPTMAGRCRRGRSGKATKRRSPVATPS